MRLSEAARKFIGHLELDRGLAESTLGAYRRDLGLPPERPDKRQQPKKPPKEPDCGLIQSLGDPEISSVDAHAVRGHLEGLMNRELGAATRARALSAITRLFAYLRAEGELAGDPLAGLDRPRIGRRIPDVLSVKEVEALIEAPDLKTSVGIRDRAMLELLFGSGLRVDELVSLELGDLFFESQNCRVRGKGGRDRFVLLSEIGVEILRRYLDEVRPRWLKTVRSLKPWSTGVEKVFFSRRNTFARREGVDSDVKLTREAVWYRVRVYARQVGVRKRITPHLLRHAYATHMVEGGADLRSVQKLLGHADIGTTEVYTHTNRERLQKLVDERHPRGSER